MKCIHHPIAQAARVGRLVHELGPASDRDGAATGPAAIAESPRERAQAALSAGIADSLGMLAQRQQLDAVFGSAQAPWAGGDVVSLKGGRGGKSTPPPVPLVDPAIAAKDAVVLLRHEALKTDTTAARAEAIVLELNQAKLRIGQMPRVGLQISAAQTVDSALTKAEQSASAKSAAEKQVKDIEDQVPKLRKAAQLALTKRGQLDDFLSDIQRDLGVLIGAETASDVDAALKLVRDNGERGTKFELAVVERLKNAQDAHAAAALSWSKIPHEPLTLCVSSTLRDRHGTALASIGADVSGLDELRAYVATLVPQFASALDHGNVLAEAKLDSLNQRQKAQKLEAQAREQAEAARLALEAAQGLKRRVESAAQELQEAQGLVVSAQQQVEQATLLWTAARDRLQQLSFGDEAEPYMVEGYTQAHEDDMGGALSGKQGAEHGLEKASSVQDSALRSFDGVKEEHRLADLGATGKQQQAIKGDQAATHGRGQAEQADRGKGEKLDSARKGLQDSQQVLAEQKHLRDLAGSQLAVDALAVHVPDPAQQKTLMEASSHEWLMKLFKAGIGLVAVQGLVSAFGSGLAALRGLVAAPRLIELLDTFSPVEVKALHDQPHIGAATLNDLVLTCTAATLKDYRDSLTLATLDSYLAEFKPPALHDLIKTVTLPVFSPLAAQFTVRALRDFSAAIGSDKLLQLTTVYGAAQIQALHGTYGDVRLKELLSDMTAAEMQAYITAVGQARLILLMDTHQLKVGALKYYGAAWLRDWRGVDDQAFNHLLALHVNEDRISGGHDLVAFRDALDVVISPQGQPRVYRGDFEPRPAADGTKVSYWLNRPDGTVKCRGSKTLIQDLATKRAAMINGANSAIWAAIRGKTFAHAGGDWVAGAYLGKHNTQRVTTFYPV